MFPYSLPLAAVSLLAIVASALIAYRHRERRVIAGAILVLGSSVWLMMQALELTSDSLPTKLFFYMLRYVGVVTVPGAWLVLAMLISGYERHVNKRNILVLTIVPILSLLLIFTNDSHSLMFTNASLDPTGPNLPLVVAFGPAYWALGVLYSYALMIVGFAMIVRRTVVSRRSWRVLGMQILLVAMVPWAFNVAYVLDPSVFMNFEPSSLVISVTGAVLLWRIVDLPVLGVLPVAHEVLVDSMNEAIFVLDEQNRIVDANPKAQSLFRSTLSQTLGSPIEKTWAEWPILEKALNSGAETGKELMFGDESDRRVYELQSSAVEGLVGNASYRLLALRDITERKRTEESLRESEDRLRRITDSMLDMVVETDLQGICKYASPSNKAILGYDPKDLIGKSLFDFVHPEDLRTVTETVQRAISTGRLWTGGRFECRYRHADGHYLWIENLANIVYDEKGQMVGGVIGARDISDRKRMEDELKRYSTQLEQLVAERTGALQESEKKYRQLIETAQEGLFTYDTNAIVTFVNPFLSVMFGYAPEEMIGKNLLTFVDDQSVGRVKAGMERRKLGIADTYEVLLIRKDESRIYANVTVSPMTDEGGRFAGGLVLLSDITERKRLEAKLAESQRLAAIGEAAAMVGHDLRNPLQTVTGTLYLAKRLAASEKAQDRDEAVRRVNSLDDEIQYMNKIVSDLQDYARPVAADRVETNLLDLVRALVSSVKIPRNVKLAVNIGEGLSNVMVDPVLFRRVLTNLIMNAVQAMPEGGRLTIAGSRADESFTVTVQDTGVGIPPENLPKVFAPFFTTKSKGQGLGLAVCKRLVEAQNGKITLKSKIGEGSTFTITIPNNV
jgi:PAS domain S-box-containing protein